jgi:hypothetical protein
MLGHMTGIRSGPRCPSATQLGVANSVAIGPSPNMPGRYGTSRLALSCERGGCDSTSNVVSWDAIIVRKNNDPRCLTATCVVGMEQGHLACSTTLYILNWCDFVVLFSSPYIL